MIDPREYNKYMKKANKASQAPKVYYDAFSGKRAYPFDPLAITKEDVRYIIGSLIIVGVFMWWIL